VLHSRPDQRYYTELYIYGLDSCITSRSWAERSIFSIWCRMDAWNQGSPGVQTRNTGIQGSTWCAAAADPSSSGNGTRNLSLGIMVCSCDPDGVQRFRCASYNAKTKRSGCGRLQGAEGPCRCLLEALFPLSYSLAYGNLYRGIWRSSAESDAAVQLRN